MNIIISRSLHFLNSKLSVFVIISVLILSTKMTAQNCNCTLSQVENNSVSSCDLVIGTVDIVATVSEFQSAISAANATGNRTILIEDGEYQVASTSSYPYITGDNIVIRSLNGNRNDVVLKGTGNMQTGSTVNGFLIAGDNVTIADLTIREVGNHGIQVSGHHLHVYNVRIQDTYEQMIKGATTGISIDSAIVECSLLEYTAGIGPNWYIGGLDIHKGKDWIVRDNYIKDITSPVSSPAEHGIHFWDNSMDNLVERNRIVNCDRGIGFGLGNSGNQNQGGIIRNNMVYNDGVGAYDDVGIGLEKSPDTKVYNNTVYIDYFNAIEYRFVGTTNVEIINNITNQNILARNGATGMLQTNELNAQANWFADLNSGDLRIATSIEDIFDKGTELPNDVIVDIDQSVRPLNSKTDIGAHEYILHGILTVQDTIELMSDPLGNIYTLTGNLSDYTIEVLDELENVLQVVPATGFFTEIDISALPSNYYFLRLTNDNNGLVRLQKILIP